MMSMPKVTINTFTGDPLIYKELTAMFDEIIDKKRVDRQMKPTILHFSLVQAELEMVVYPTIHYNRASPNVMVSCHGHRLMEVKCPYAARHNNPTGRYTERDH